MSAGHQSQKLMQNSKAISVVEIKEVLLARGVERRMEQGQSKLEGY